MFNSKRFVAYIISILLFILLTFLTKHSPLELAGAISVLSGIYIAGQTFRSSNIENKQ
jgi:hypothetical protein